MKDPNKFDNIYIRTNNIPLLAFFFPNHLKARDVDELFVADRKVLYVGEYKPDLQDRLASLLTPFVSIVGGKPKFDLTSRDGLLQFVYAKHNKTVPKKVTGDGIGASAHEGMGDDDFIKAIKYVWVTGTFPYIGDTTTMWEVYRSLTALKAERAKAISMALESYSKVQVLNSIVRVLVRCISDNKAKGSYGLLLADIKRYYGEDYIRAVLLKVSTTKPIVDKSYLLDYLLVLLNRRK